MTMPSSEPLVTVYIACFNYEKYIDQAIQSVLRQSLTDFELIIIDDGSQDGSRERIATYLGTPSVRVIFQDNRGLNVTNNIALRAARGKYLVRLDADDYLDENALLVLSNALEQDPDAALVFPDYYLVDRDGQILGQERRDAVSEEDSLLDRPAHGACTMFRRSCLLEVGGYSEDYTCQDGVDIWLKLTERYGVRNVNLPLFYYRRHGDNLTGDQQRLLDTRSRIFEDHAKARNLAPVDAVAVLPVRGPGVDPNCVSMEPLSGRRVIDWTVEASLDAEPVRELIVTTNDSSLREHLVGTYGSRIQVCDREAAGTVENVSFEGAVRDAFARRTTKSGLLAVLELTCNYPFRTSMYLTKAVNVMRLYEVDVVLGVTIDSPTLYVHDGNGLRPVLPLRPRSALRFEADLLYRETGGFRLIAHSHFMATEPLAPRVGHVVLTEDAAMPVRTSRDLRLARAIAGGAD